MTSPVEKPSVADVPSAAACAQAAAWIARLHGESRTAKVEAGFKRWLAASPEHRAAFEMANDIWVGVERLPKPAPPALVGWPSAGLLLTVPRALAALAVVVALAIGALSVFHFHDSGLATAVGEQRNLSLEDGTRVSLNTASRIHVRYDRDARRVELDQGEAFFEVAKRPHWPFIVTAGGKQVVALGTAFLVRRDDARITVTLVEGKVTVSPARESLSSEATHSLAPQASPAPRSVPQAHRQSEEDLTLSPGQRVTFAANGLPTLDQPSLDRVTAWQRGQVILDHTPLADAVAEMNRYSDVELKIETPEAGRAQVTGIFRIGDSENFAQAVAETYRLKVVARAGEIVITGVP